MVETIAVIGAIGTGIYIFICSIAILFARKDTLKNKMHKSIKNAFILFAILVLVGISPYVANWIWSCFSNS